MLLEETIAAPHSDFPLIFTEARITGAPPGARYTVNYGQRLFQLREQSNHQSGFGSTVSGCLRGVILSFAPRIFIPPAANPLHIPDAPD